MKHFIVIAGQRLITLLVAYGLLNPSTANFSLNSSTTTQAGDLTTSSRSRLEFLQASNNTVAAHDNEIWLNDLEHNSRDLLYRTPGGPVETGTSVTLRLRAASGDLTAARVRIFNDRQNTLSLLEMSLVADDDNHEWWQVTLQPSSLPTVYWYRFIAIDGTDVDYYADDNELLGGLGSPTDDEVDNSWQLTIFDPAFQTPDWVKDAIIYQIFPDRFRDGDLSNNTAAGSFYYGTNSTIFRSGSSYWNEEICDPRNPSGGCPGVYGQNFYGGDLQGVINMLDYLKELGITAIYLNPIFKSPSNNGYDTTNYLGIDENLGGIGFLTTLASAAAAHGMVIILDGNFTHTSSDSIYFDRYHLYPDLVNTGACESTGSRFRDWFFFYDVSPGTGTCVGSNGTPNAANYISWGGLDYYPILNSLSGEVRDYFWAQDSADIGPYWVAEGRADGWRLDAGGEIDPGVLGDSANQYWEGFRTAVHAVNPTAYIVGEEWGNAASWTLGSEWDASMNYQFSTAVLGFWRDEPFVDNDHYTGSAAGIIEPLLPSQINERLLNLQERYAPEALAAMMNLLDSHNTNRALFMLDQNSDLNNSSIYWNPNYDWSNAITRLRGAVLLQMTLPGAPTIYYGDEVGLVGPVSFDTESNTWQDDPYNRQPYPWVGDECDQIPNCGTPYYSFLQSQSNQDTLREYYITLTLTRNDHPALRTGSFDPLLVDDPNMVYAFGRRLLDPEDAALVVLNRSGQSKTVTLDLYGYISTGSILGDVLHSNTQYSIAEDGSLTLQVPAMSGMLLILISGDILPPAAPSNIIATEGENQVSLTWNTVPEAYRYHIFRSIVPAGGYDEIGTTRLTTYIDTSVTNGTRYYYVVRASKDLGVISEDSNEVSAIPHWELDWSILLSPPETTHIVGISPTEQFLGQVTIEGITSQLGATQGLIAQVGYGPAGVVPAEWPSWTDAPFDSDQGDNDQFASPLQPEATGDYQVVYRYSTTSGREWVYADLNGPFIGTPPNPGVLHVLPGSDITPPVTPANLTLVDWGDHFVEMDWNPISEDPTLYAYDIYRSTNISSPGTAVARVYYPSTVYTDFQVISGTTYYYRIQAVDTSFNRSALSNQITATPLTRQVSVTFIVDVPDYTEGSVYIVGDHPKLGSWDPGKILMTRVDDNSWTITLDFQEGVVLKYTFTRGNYAWLDVERAADGNTEIPNRTLLVEAGSSGVLVVNSTVANWRDPLVAASFPTNNATNVSIIPTITVTWNQAMNADTTFVLTGSAGNIPGTFTYDPFTWTVSFIPSIYLQLNTIYTMTASYQTDAGGDPQLVTRRSTFTTVETMPIFTTTLPILQKP